MLYPLYVHVGNAKEAHGVIFPDFPGCHAAADTWEELPAAAQEAVEAHFYDEEGTVPPPSALEDLVSSPEYSHGVWMLFDLDLTKIKSKAVRLNISLPERLVAQIDAAAEKRKMTRSAFLALAAEQSLHDVTVFRRPNGSLTFRRYDLVSDRGRNNTRVGSFPMPANWVYVSVDREPTLVTPDGAKITASDVVNITRLTEQSTVPA